MPNKSASAKSKSSRSVRGITGVIVLVLAAAVTIYVISGSKKPPVYTLSDTSLTISAQFGETVALSDITGVQLQDTMPPNLLKVTGANLGTILRVLSGLTAPS